MFVMILFGFTVFGGVGPFSIGEYAPMPAYLSPFDTEVFVYGQVTFANGTYAIGIEVRLFATDQLIEDIVFTDHMGFFISSVKFKTGQIISVTIGNEMIYPEEHQYNFIKYDAREYEDWWLGTYVLDP
jgi:hypothetical protein